jgi:DNA-directed RNA polymerase beta subunit
MIMNSHAIPSRMTMAQLLEALLGKAAAAAAAIGNATTFMNEGSPAAAIGKVLFGFLTRRLRTGSTEAVVA